MASADPFPASRPVVGAVMAWLRTLRPPVNDARFWVVQAGVVTLAVLHDVVLGHVPSDDLAGIPAPITSGLLLIPVIYAALTFGVRGAVGTALWSTALIVPHWLPERRLANSHFWIEASFLLAVNAVAIIVGQRVENERLTRLRAETALRTARIAEVRYRSLFEGQPAPVIITDATGTVSEVNTAATRLFGLAASGHPLDDLLGVTAADLLGADPNCLRLPLRDGEERLLVPIAHRLAGDDGADLVQVVLTDVTEEHRRQEEQRLFASQLLKVQEEERRRLARELHDDPLQNLTYLARVMEDLTHHPQVPGELVDRLSRSAVLASDAATALRKIIYGLRPPVLDDLGLVSALRQLIDEARDRSRLSIDLRVTGDPVRLPPELELAAYRIAQESVRNVLRHAHASRASVRLRFGESLVLTVVDDGCGLPQKSRSPGEPGAGLGLIGMRERVGTAGGSLEVTPRSPHGTRVHASLPLVHPESLRPPPGWPGEASPPTTDRSPDGTAARR